MQASNSERALRAFFRSNFLLTGSLHFAASAAISLFSSGTVNMFLFRIAVVVALIAAAASSNLSCTIPTFVHLDSTVIRAKHEF